MVQFISSTEQLADALTKALPPNKFRQVRHNLHVRDLPSRLRGRVENKIMLAEINDEDQQSIVTEDEDQHLKAKEVNTRVIEQRQSIR